MFSETLSKSKFLEASIHKGSVSTMDAKNRIKTYSAVMQNYVDLKHEFKKFSSYVDNELLANQYFNATVTGLAKSFAGYATIERSLDNPNALLYFLNLIGVATNTTVLPNLGTENLGTPKNAIRYSSALTAGDVTYSVALGKKLVPGSLKLTIKRAASTVTLTDDRQGNLIGPANILVLGTVNYATGAVEVEFTTAFTVANTDTMVIEVTEDQVGTQSINRYKTELEHIMINTLPELLVGETDLVSLAAMKKVINTDIQDVVMSKLTELYTKLINRQIVLEIDNNTTGDTFEISLDGTAYGDYRSLIDKFSGELNAVDTELAKKSVKGVKATAYIVGTDVVTEFRKTSQIGLFKEEPQAYINDLVGFYKGIPVLEHTELDPKVGHAIHKTMDGNMAPVMRGIFLPLTNTPQVGNYQNPTQMATGVFYQENNKSITSQLNVKFELTA